MIVRLFSLLLGALAGVTLLVSTVAAQDESPTITSADNTTFTVDSFGTFTVTTTGSPTPNISTDDPLPSGVSFQDNGDGTATISGTPQTGSGAQHIIRITAQNENGQNAQDFNLFVNELPTITSADHTTFTVGTNGQFTVTTGSGYPTPPSLCVCPGLPPSPLSFTDNNNGTGSLHGTPAAGTGGTYELQVTAINQTGETVQDFTLEIDEAPAITSANHVTFHEDTGTSFTVTATGFPAPTLSKNGSLPSGITFDPATGVLSGTPALGSAGTYPITFTATNGIGSNAGQNFTLTITAPLPCSPPPSGLVGWWPGDGSAIDIQNDNNGTLHGSANFANGRVGKAFNFDGTTGYVSIGNPEALKLLAVDETSHTGITMDAWVKPNALPSNGSLVAVATKWNSNNSTGTSGDAYGLFLINNGGTLAALAQLNPGGAEVTLQGGNVPLNAFTHVALTFETNSGSLALFVNGVQVNARIVDGSIVRSDVNVMIGRENDNTSPRFFAGLIDEVEIYNRALSASEISDIYNAGANGKCKVTQCVAPPTNIIGWWPGDNTAIDIQGGNNGTLQGNYAGFATGKVGQAFHFQGNNDGVEVPYTPALDFGADSFTIDTWVRLDGFTSYGILAAHEQTGSDDGWTFLLNGFDLQIAFNRSNAAKVLDFVPTLQQWYHLAVTRSGNTFKFYVDGVQLGTDQTSAAVPTPVNGPLKIGKANGFQSLTGRIDEFEIVHRALSASEIQAIYNAGRAGKCKSFTMYVSNKADNTIEKFDVEGNDLGPFAITGLNGPAGLAFDSAGNLYVANNTDSTIRKFDATGADLGVFAATGLDHPIGIAFDASGNLYAANSGSSTVRKFSPTGTDLGAFASTGLSNPDGIAFDGSGNLYVVNDANSTIRKFDATGVDLGNFGTTGLNSPTGMAFDTNGIAYVSNAADNTISKFDITGVSSPFANAGVNGPLGLAFDTVGNLYAVGNGDNTVGKLDLGGVSSIFANSGLNSPYFTALKPISPLVPVLRNNSFNRPTSGHVMLSGQALPNATVYIQATTTLQSGFSTLGTTIADGNGAYQYDDASVGSVTKRFYRASYP
jgi:sugar lactone lactonase YvrE